MSGMSTARIRQVGSSEAVCGRCGAATVLTVWELRRAAGWWRRDAGAPLSRSASCPVCVTTYPVRCTDDTAVGAARRRDAAGEPTGREWSYRRTDDCVGAAR
jgi:hypothetical protein